MAVGQIVAAEAAAVGGHEANWQALLRASRPPSLGGSPIAPPSTGSTAITLRPGGLQQAPQPASVFGRLQVNEQGSAPGTPPLAPAPGFSNGFGAQNRGFGTGGGAFGGGGFGSSGFGSAAQPKPAVAFGGGAAAQARQFGGQLQQPGPPQNSASGAAFGTQPTFGGGARPAFGSQRPQLGDCSAIPGPFQVGDAAQHMVEAQPTGTGTPSPGTSHPCHFCLPLSCERTHTSLLVQDSVFVLSVAALCLNASCTARWIFRRMERGKVYTRLNPRRPT